MLRSASGGSVYVYSALTLFLSRLIKKTNLLPIIACIVQRKYIIQH